MAAALRQRAQQQTLRGIALEADRLSNVDALTGAANRRQFDVRTAEMLATMDGATAVGLMILDVDHFKHVNDTEGHPVGDLVLRIVAARLANVVGDAHMLVRWGGEEFVVLATGLTQDAVGALAERLRSVISDHPFALDEHRSLPMTASVGWVTSRLDALDAAVAAADDALHRAKRAGRNRLATQ